MPAARCRSADRRAAKAKPLTKHNRKRQKVEKIYEKIPHSRFSVRLDRRIVSQPWETCFSVTPPTAERFGLAFARFLFQEVRERARDRVRIKRALIVAPSC